MRDMGVLMGSVYSYMLNYAIGDQGHNFWIFCFVMYNADMGSLLLQSQVLQPGAASGGSESFQITSI